MTSARRGARRPASSAAGEARPQGGEGLGDAAVFDRLGARWDRLWYVSPRRTAQEVRAVLDAAASARGGVDLPKGARVLDIGCGTGRHALGLAKAGLRVTGVDLAPAMVRAATAKASKAGVSGRVQFARGDALRLPVRPAKFDLAISLCEGAFGQPRLPSGDARLIREARRALRPDGVLVLVALERGWLDRQGEWRYDPARRKNVGREWHTFEDGRRGKVEISTRAYRPEEAAALLGRCGLEVRLMRGAAPGAYGVHDLESEEAMQYMIAARRPLGSAPAARRTGTAPSAPFSKRKRTSER